ncbi:MFS general substrate transporter [Hypomontagnella monticulosa]|nr:MFS general substrate transporter [Hypomontagnella monticulosa]
MSEPTAGNDDITATERTPLVGGSENATTSSSTWKPGHSRSPTLASVGSVISVPRVHNPSTIINLIYLYVLVVSATGGFQNIPMTRIYEDILCHEYYGRTPGEGEPIDEGDCKMDSLQSELAYLFAVLEALTAGISCLAALPWGIAADRIGRKPVFGTCSMGMTLYVLLIIIVAWFPDKLPVRLLWLSAVAHLFGGTTVINACTYSIVSDVVPESKRAIAFMRVHVTSMVGNLVSPALASAMMSSTGPWPVLLLTLVLWIAAIFLIGLLPETFEKTPQSRNEESQHTTIKARAMQIISQLKDSLSIIRIRSVALVLCIMLLSYPVAMCTLQFMVQFISKHYHIPLKQTGYIQSIYGVAHIVVVLLLIPAISSLLVQPSTPKWLRVADERKRDVILGRWSYFSYAAGAFILGVSPSLPVFVVGLLVMSLGSGSTSFFKSIGASHVDAEHRSRLFTIMTLLEVSSNIWTTPMLAGLFTVGMRLGGIWIGLPYLGVSLACFFMFMFSLFVQPSPNRGEDEESPPEDEAIVRNNE